MLDNEIFKTLSKANLSPEMLAAVKDLIGELDSSHRKLMEITSKSTSDKTSRFDKQIEHMNSLFNKEVDYLIRASEDESLTIEQREEVSAKIAAKINDAQKAFDDIIAKANEESDKDMVKAQEETERSEKQKVESFASIVAVLAGATLTLSGVGVVVKSPKNLKAGLGMIGLGLTALGVPVAKKYLPLNQQQSVVFREDDIIDVEI